MPAHLRFQSSPWATHHVVSRCIQGYGFLKPTQQIRKVKRGVFAYSANLFCRSLFGNLLNKYLAATLQRTLQRTILQRTHGGVGGRPGRLGLLPDCFGIFFSHSDSIS